MAEVLVTIVDDDESIRRALQRLMEIGGPHGGFVRIG